MGDLPLERTQPARPFEFTTVDLFGLCEVKDTVRKRVRLKVWGVVFCCMASRAIHSDVVGDQSTEGFLLAYQRFTALRGHPRKLWSDPGKNFVGAKPALKKLYLFLDQLEKADLRITFQSVSHVSPHPDSCSKDKIHFLVFLATSFSQDRKLHK